MAKNLDEANLLRKDIDRAGLGYEGLRVVKRIQTYTDYEGCCTSNPAGHVVVNGGYSSYVLEDTDLREFVSRNSGHGYRVK